MLPANQQQHNKFSLVITCELQMPSSDCLIIEPSSITQANSANPNRAGHVLITKTRLYNFDPLKPHFYIVKLGFTVVYIISLIFAQKHRLWVLVRTASPRRF